MRPVVVPHADFGHPAVARVYDYLLGGTDNFAADRELAERLMNEEKGHPGLRELARENRDFVLKASRWAASMLQAGQFIDVGCGLRPSVHQEVRQARPGARVAYVDGDPVVVSLVRAIQLAEGWEGTVVIDGDASDPPSVLGNPVLRELIDLDQPTVLLFGGTLSAMPAGRSREALAGFMAAMVPGSAVIISCAHYDDLGLAERMETMFGAAGTWHNHTRDDIASFFSTAGLRLVRNRVADVRCWPLLPEKDSGAAVIGGIGIRD